MLYTVAFWGGFTSKRINNYIHRESPSVGELSTRAIILVFKGLNVVHFPRKALISGGRKPNCVVHNFIDFIEKSDCSRSPVPAPFTK